MYKITEKVALNPTVTKMVIEAPLIAKKAKPGQFIIVRPFEDSERIPLTVAGYDLSLIHISRRWYPCRRSGADGIPRNAAGHPRSQPAPPHGTLRN